MWSVMTRSEISFFGSSPYFTPVRRLDMLHDVLHGVDKKEVVHSLHDAGKTLKAHAGVDVRVCHRRVIALAVAVELGKHDVPEFNIAVAVAADAAGRLAAAVFFAAVKIDFGAGAAGAGAVFPEIIFFAETHDVRRVDADFLRPDVKRLVVVQIDRDPELVHRKLQHLRAEFPCPRRGLVLKIIAERKVAQHLKKRAVAVGNADIFNVAGADALLAGRHALARRRYLAGKVLFHRRHAGVDQQQAVVVLRDQGKARQPQMPLRLKKRQIHFAQFVKSRPFHTITPFCPLGK